MLRRATSNVRTVLLCLVYPVLCILVVSIDLRRFTNCCVDVLSKRLHAKNDISSMVQHVPELDKRVRYCFGCEVIASCRVSFSGPICWLQATVCSRCECSWAARIGTVLRRLRPSPVPGRCIPRIYPFLTQTPRTYSSTRFHTLLPGAGIKSTATGEGNQSRGMAGKARAMRICWFGSRSLHKMSRAGPHFSSVAASAAKCHAWDIHVPIRISRAALNGEFAVKTHKGKSVSCCRRDCCCGQCKSNGQRRTKEPRTKRTQRTKEHRENRVLRRIL